MLKLSAIRDHTDQVIEGLSRRGKDYTYEIKSLLELDIQKRKLQKDLEELLSQLNKNAKEIGLLLREGKQDQAQSKKNESTAIKQRSTELQHRLQKISGEIEKALTHIPNTLHSQVRLGSDDTDHDVCYQSETADLPKSLPHWEISDHLQLIDFTSGVKVSGAGFPLYLGLGARLQRALAQYFLDYNTDRGYKEVLPPFLVNEASAFGTGQLPDKDQQMYRIKDDGLYLIPTSEISSTNIYRDTILAESELPIRLTSYSPCFRREAGSYGKEVRGLNRVHQFEKVEIVQIVHPEKSMLHLEEMVEHVRILLESLKLPFRLLRLCGKDTGFSSAITYDFEVYATGQQRWLEVSSVSNFESFQSYRMKLRYKGGDRKTHFCHTLNGSSLALPRIYAALLENNYKDGAVELPEVLHTYMRGVRQIK